MQEEQDVIQEIVTKEQLRRSDYFELYRLIREANANEHKRMLLLAALSDPVKNARMYAVLKSLHEAILNNDDMHELLAENIEEDDAELFARNKHNRFYKSKQLYLEFEDHPVQVDMQKKGAIGIRKIKKADTYNQHVSIMKEAKMNYLQQLLNERLLKEREETDRKLMLMKFSIDEQLKELRDKQDALSEGQQKILKLIESGIKEKKIAAMKLKLENGMTNTDIAKEMNVTRQTVVNWMKEMQEVLDSGE